MPAPALDCIVIGAGVAGLAAARDVAQAGRRVLVIEARNRTGGRVHTVRDSRSTLPIELGAEFVHGTAADSFAIARAARAIVTRLPDDHYWAEGGQLAPVERFWDDVAAMGRDIARRIGRAQRSDWSFEEYLTRAGLRGRRRRLLLQFVEGYHAADPAKISAKFLAVGSDEQTDSGSARQARILNGSDALVRWLERSLDPELAEVRLDTVASLIRWSRRGVAVHCENAAGRTLPPFAARTVVVTVPAAVLAAGALRFVPALADKEGAVGRLEPGHVFKMVLRFKTAFWDEDGFLARRLARVGRQSTPLNFVHDLAQPVGTWWTASPVLAPVLTAWAGGRKGEQLLSLDPEARIDRVIDSLAATFGVRRGMLDDQLDGRWSHDWRADPWSRSAYSYPGVGGIPAQRVLARPVDGTLFFAGEATTTDETATVSGAIRSGRRAAKELLETVRKRQPRARAASGG